MAKKIKSFEELRCRMAARELVNIVCSACEEGRLMRDFDTRSQIKRAALSTMNNIAEVSEGLVAKNLSDF